MKNQLKFRFSSQGWSYYESEASRNNLFKITLKEKDTLVDKISDFINPGESLSTSTGQFSILFTSVEGTVGEHDGLNRSFTFYLRGTQCAQVYESMLPDIFISKLESLIKQTATVQVLSAAE